MKVGRLKISIDTHPRLVLGALLVVAALCHFITMPKFICQGDNLAIKAEAAHLVNTGEIGFDPDEKAALASLGKEDGQYFFPNESRHKLFSKYGFFYTISYLPPIWLKKQVTGSVDLLDASKSMTFAFNCYNIVWALVYLSYLYCLYLYFCRNRWLAVALVFLSVYPGYAWYYLRTPDKEVLQMASFTAAIYHMLRYLGSSRNDAVSPWHLVAAFLWGGYTYLLKPLYVLLVVGMAAVTVTDAFAAGVRVRLPVSEIFSPMLKHWPSWAGWCSSLLLCLWPIISCVVEWCSIRAIARTKLCPLNLFLA